MGSPQGDLPLKLLTKSINSNVLVKLKDGSEFMGLLERCDPTMNLVLTNAVEVDEDKGDPITNLGKVFIRGSNILFIAIAYDKLST
ncbi:MAG: Sm ribonucleo [Thermofilum sp. ex4484_15]|nr:MAG: Sm ribonucleo [Thermofilum sp. ex4484_15]